MKILPRILLSLIIVFSSIISFSQHKNDSLQKTTPPYNIKDYYLLLPDSMLNTLDSNVSLNQRLLALKYKTLEKLWNHKGFWIIDTLDFKNGYMKFSSTGDGGGIIFEITYFIKKDKTREIAVNKIYWDLAVSYSVVNIYTFNNNTWKDITKHVLPVINTSDFLNTEFSDIINKYSENNPVIYHLPEKGKTITVKIDIGTITGLFDNKFISETEYMKIKKLLHPINLVWNNGSFFKK